MYVLRSSSAHKCRSSAMRWVRLDIWLFSKCKTRRLFNCASDPLILDMWLFPAYSSARARLLLTKSSVWIWFPSIPRQVKWGKMPSDEIVSMFLEWERDGIAWQSGFLARTDGWDEEWWDPFYSRSSHWISLRIVSESRENGKHLISLSISITYVNGEDSLFVIAISVGLDAKHFGN